MSIAVITGASTGLGREFARSCAANYGYDLVLIARDITRLEALASEIRLDTSRTVRVIAADLALAGAPAQIYERMVPFVNDVHLLVNNAGFGLVGAFNELDETEQLRMIQLNIAALTHFCRLFLPGFVKQGRGRIINIASTAAFQPGPLMAVYYATKAYVLSFSEALHNELKGTGVTVTTLCPGPTKTEFAERAGMSSKLFERLSMNARDVVRIGMEASAQGRSLVVAGHMNTVGAFLTRFAPRQFAASLARRFQERK